MYSDKSNTALPMADSFFFVTWYTEMFNGLDSYLSAPSRRIVLTISMGLDGNVATRDASSIAAWSVLPPFSDFEPRFHLTYTVPEAPQMHWQYRSDTDQSTCQRVIWWATSIEPTFTTGKIRALDKVQLERHTDLDLGWFVDTRDRRIGLGNSSGGGFTYWFIGMRCAATSEIRDFGCQLLFLRWNWNNNNNPNNNKQQPEQQQATTRTITSNNPNNNNVVGIDQWAAWQANTWRVCTYLHCYCAIVCSTTTTTVWVDLWY
jgi:hypothetical protein